jgi:hypothetical protein
MNLSPDQAKRFWREWAAVKRTLKAQGKTDDECEQARYAMLNRAGFSSLTKVDRTKGFDRVLAELGALRDDLPRTRETTDPCLGEARRLRHVIRAELLPCLALYEPDPDRYLQSVIADKFRWFKTDRPTRQPTLDDLAATPNLRPRGNTLKEFPSQLEQVLMTINARLHAKRKAAGDTVHDMLTKAGLPCTCSLCSVPPMILPHPAASPEPAHAEDPF